jgi:hypothetical protein
MYIGSGGPRRLLNITPTRAPSDKPVLDLLTEYFFQAFDSATSGLVVAIGGSYYDFEVNASTAEQTCTCGAKAPGCEYYIRLPGLFGSILPSLALHYLIWHRTEIPQRHLELIQRASTDNLVVQIGRRNLEPPELAERRADAQHAQALSIVRNTLEELRSRADPEVLAGALATAINDSGVQQVGWSITYPERDAVEAVYAQIDPDGGTNFPTGYMSTRIDEWACDPDRTLSEAELVLSQALESLTSK